MTYAIITATAAFATALASGFLSLWSILHVERARHALGEMHRLGGATGALRFQLFLSTRSVIRRMRQYYNHRPDRPFPLRTERDAPSFSARSIVRGFSRHHTQGPRRPFPRRAGRERASETEYHAAGLLIFRLMRPITLSYLVERETLAGDWLLDPNMVDVQRFNHAAFEMLTGDRLGDEFGKGDVFADFCETSCWDPEERTPQQGRQVRPFQRVRASYLRTAAAALVVTESGGSPVRRCMGHDEFLLSWQHPGDNATFHDALKPVKEVINRFNPTNNPVFWLRLVGYSYACKWFHDQVREKSARHARAPWHRHSRVRYTSETLDVVDMLKAAGSPYLTDHAEAYRERFREIIDTIL